MTDENKRRLLVRLYRTERTLEFLQQHDKESAWKKTMRRHALRRFSTICRWAASSAACIGLLIGLGYFMFFQPAATDDSFAVLQELYPETGSNRATLTLESGETIDLAVQQGVIAQSIQNVDGKELRYEKQQATAVRYNTLSVPRGGEYQLTLSDGTRIWMNADSHLTYPVAFADSTREVVLEGEAYFEVAHDASHPFRVHTTKGDIQVLGTSFNVQAYPQEPVCATLLSGKVTVSTSTSAATLLPDSQAVLDIDGDIEVTKVDGVLAASWRTGTHIFKNMPLREIAAQLSRWYNVDIRFRSAELGDVCFTGGIVRSEELAFAISVIADVSCVRFIREGSTIWIEKK